MNDPLILFDADRPEIELVPYALVRDDQALRRQYLGWLNDVDVVRPIASPALLAPKGPEFIDESFARFTQPGCQGFFIRYVPDDAYVGTTKLDTISVHTRSAWDGIMIGNKRYHGRGLSTHVYRILLGYAFLTLELNRVSGGCNEKNIPMVKTFARVGYTPEGRLRQADRITDEYCDHLYFGILRAEFFAANSVNLKSKAGQEK